MFWSNLCNCNQRTFLCSGDDDDPTASPARPACNNDKVGFTGVFEENT